MPESEYEYVDEQGNPLSPEEVASLGDDYEVVDEVVPEPVQPAPAPVALKASRAVLAVAAVVVLGIGGVVAYGMHAMGQRNTVEDVKAAVSSKASVVSSAAASKSSEVRESVAARPVTGVGCREEAFAGAAWVEGAPKPANQLAVQEIIAMPTGFTERQRKAAATEGQAPLRAAVQLSDEQLGVYIASTANAQSNGEALWWKVTVAIAGGFSVLGETYGDGHDVDMKSACATIADPGTYLVTGQGGSEAKPTEVTLIKPERASGTVTGWALIGDKLAQVRVEHTPAESSGGDDETGEGGSSSSAVPSK